MFSKRRIDLTLIFRSLIHLDRLILIRTWIERLGYEVAKLGSPGSNAFISVPLKHSFHLGLAVVFDFYIFSLVKTVNSSILQYSLESLTRKTSYTVQVMASTSAGGTSGTRINFKTLSISEYSFSPWECLLGLSFRLVTDDVSQRQGEGRWKGEVRRTICSLTHWPSWKTYGWGGRRESRKIESWIWKDGSFCFFLGSPESS